MKKILVFALAAFMIGFATSCAEDVLEPTNIEKDWAKDIDLSNSYVKDIYEQTGVAILTEFNDTLDVLYQGSDEGVLSNVSITHLSADQKDAAIKWLKENILDCFSTDCIKTYFPRRIFLCQKLVVDDTPGNVGGWVEEVRYTNNLWGSTGVQHAFPFAQGLAISVNTEFLLNEETAVDYATQFRVDIMTIICHELFMNNSWLDGIQNNTDIFPDDVTELYNRYAHVKNTYDYKTDGSGVKYLTDDKLSMWNLWYGCAADDPKRGDPVTIADSKKMSLEGYFQFGFPDHGQNNNQGYGQTAFNWVAGTLTFGTYYDRAPDTIQRDARNLISALCDLQDYKLPYYGEFIIQRLYIMSEYFKEYGVDFKKFNPVVSTMYEMFEN